MNFRIVSSTFMALKKIFMIFILTSYVSILTAQLSGTVYEELPVDGTTTNSYGEMDANELGVDNVTVTITDASGVVSIQTTSGGGLWSDPVTDFPARVEFTWPNHPWLESSPDGSGSNTSVQFYSTSSTDVDFGLQYPRCFVSNNMEQLATTMFTNGDYSIDGSNISNSPALFSFDQDQTGVLGTATIDEDLAVEDIGTIWGLAWDPVDQHLFGSAVLKRHAALPPDGLGALYRFDYSGASVSKDLLYAFPASAVGSIGPRNLPANGEDPSRDNEAYTETGKIGIGDIDLSDDYKTLYAVTLEDKTVYALDVENYVSGTLSATDVTALPAYPSPGCTGGTDRPWALSYHQGKLYLGVICDGADNLSSLDITAQVYVFDFTTNLWDIALSSFPLDFERGGAITQTSDCNRWRNWTDDWNRLRVVTTWNSGGNSFGVICGPQPILSDIEFDVDGSMILAFTDRFGLQGGYKNWSPDPPNQATFWIVTVGGDVMRTSFNPSTNVHVLENMGTTATGTGCGLNGQGVGGGEYYCGEDRMDLGNGAHEETTMGALAIMKGSDEVSMTTMDPISNLTDHGGIDWLNNNSGEKNRGLDGLQLYERNDNATPNGTQGKAVGLGDLELLSTPAPVEIGNFVWEDSNNNGLQDPGENGLSGITVELIKNGSVIASATTDAAGNYIFSNNPNLASSLSHIYNITQLMANMDYTIRFPSSVGSNSLTSVDSGSNNFIDSDANATNGETMVQSTDIPISGANNHSFDAGYSSLPNCTITVDEINVTLCSNDEVDVSVTVSWTSAPGNQDIEVSIGTDIDYINAPAAGSSGTASISFVVTADGSAERLVYVKFEDSDVCIAYDSFALPEGCSDCPPETAVYADWGTNFNTQNAILGSTDFDWVLTGGSPDWGSVNMGPPTGGPADGSARCMAIHPECGQTGFTEMTMNFNDPIREFIPVFFAGTGQMAVEVEISINGDPFDINDWELYGAGEVSNGRFRNEGQSSPILASWLSLVDQTTEVNSATITFYVEFEPGFPAGASCVIELMVYGAPVTECIDLGNDYGDIPDTYGDICYELDCGTPATLGDNIDAEAGMQYSNDGEGDDSDGTPDDEDGVVFVGGIDFTSNGTKEITISWNSSDDEGYISGWIDWDGDGNFNQAGDQIITNYTVGINNGNPTGSNTFSIDVPELTNCGISYARFIITSDRVSPTESEGPTGLYCEDDSSCNDGEVEDYQVTLSGCTGPCDLTDPGETHESCNDNNTPSDPADDYVTFNLNPTGSNLGAGYTLSVDNGGTISPTSGSYGSSTSFQLQNGSADGTLYTITITDNGDSNCSVTTTVQQSSCSSSCDLTDPGESNETCNNNGTPADGNDDYITFDLDPTGLNLGGGYTVSVDNGGTISPSSGLYGNPTSFQLQNGSANGALYTITIIDENDESCTISTTVQQDPCSTCPHPNCLGVRVRIIRNN